jgi:hypothetical protein
MGSHMSKVAPEQPLVAAVSRIKVCSSLVAHLYHIALLGLHQSRHAPIHRAKTQTSHGCRILAKNGEKLALNSKVRVIERRDGRTLLIDKGLREPLHQTRDSYPNFPMVAVMEAGQLAVTDGLHIVQDPAGTLATLVDLVKDRVIRVGSLSVMSVVGRVS